MLARFDATRLLIFINMQFMVTVLIEWIAYGERPTGWFVLGCALVLAAVALDRVRILRTRAPICPLVEP